MKNVVLSILIVLLLCVSHVVMAQVPSSSPKPSLTFRTLGADCAPEGLNILSGSNTVAVSILQGMRSMPQSYLGGSPMIIFRVENGKDGKPTQVPVATVDLSQAGTYPLLVFSKGTKNSNQPAVSVLREDSKSFPAGTLRIINGSTMTLNAKIPSGTVPILPSAIKDYYSKEGGIFNASIEEIGTSAPFLVFNSNIGILPGKRTLFLVLPPASPGGHVQIQRHTDGVPAQ